MDRLLLIRITLLFGVVVLYTSNSNNTSDAAEADSGNAHCSKSNRNANVQDEIRRTEEAIMKSVTDYKLELQTINEEMNVKLDEVDKKQKKIRQLKNVGGNTSSITITELRNDILKLQVDLDKIKAETSIKISEQEKKLKDNEESLKKKIICVEEVGYQNMRNNLNLTSNVVSCGGVIVGNKEGLLQFRSNETFSKYRKCIWTLRIKNYVQMKLQILADTFTENDFIVITGIDETYYSNYDHNGDMRFDVALSIASGLGAINLTSSDKVIKHGDRNVFDLYGPFIFISFVTENYNEGSGFLIKYEGIHNRKIQKIYKDLTYINLHDNNSSGSIAYPPPPSERYPNNVFWTLVVNPPTPEKVSALKLEYTDIESDHSCDSDVLKIYTYDKHRNSLNFKRYCETDKTYRNEIIPSSSDGAFIITFISDATDDTVLDDKMGHHGVMSNHKGFRFSWNTSLV